MTTSSGKLIGYARVSTRHQSTDRQVVDLAAAGVRRDDLYVDHGVSGARARRPEFERALDALHAGDTLAITTLDVTTGSARTKGGESWLLLTENIDLAVLACPHNREQGRHRSRFHPLDEADDAARRTLVR